MCFCHSTSIKINFVHSTLKLDFFYISVSKSQSNHHYNL